jgi:hypothetical protein
MFTDLNVGTAAPAYTTGWAQNAYASVSFSVPDNWTAGRIWVSHFILSVAFALNITLSGSPQLQLQLEPRPELVR